MANVTVYNMEGNEVGTMELNDAVFGVEVNEHLVHLAVVRQLANNRQGTQKAKTRSEVSGGGRKPWRQKGTGHARQGSIRAPQWTGGGVVFAPVPRDYEVKMNKKERRAALKSALTSKVQENKLVVVDSLTLAEAKTKEMQKVLTNLKADKALVVTAADDQKVVLSARNIAAARFGLTFSIHRYEDHDSLKDGNRVIHVKAPVPGAFNAYNIMAALLAVHGTTGKPLEELAPLVASLESIKGRMTVIDEGQPFEVIVDYAHTPSSFETIFPPLRKRCSGKMLCVFGSGGERDVKKRPLQGEIAAKFCDTIILTDEDPRGEDRVALLEQIAAGAEKYGKQKEKDLFIVPDRPKAIRFAFSKAGKNDIVLLLGKSHENSIIYKDHVMEYDEISEAKKALAEIGFNSSGETK